MSLMEKDADYIRNIIEGKKDILCNMSRRLQIDKMKRKNGK